MRKPTAPDPQNPPPIPVALKVAWQEAEAALLRYKASRDTLDRERAAAKLYEVALREAECIVKKRVDTKLPPQMQRNKAEMASNAVSSVMAQERTRMTVITDTFDPERGRLRTLMARILFSKVMDYVRAEPIPGVVGRASMGKAEKPGKAQSELRMFAQSLAVLAAPSTSSTLAPGADNSPAQTMAAPSDALPAPSHNDDHVTMQILGSLTRFLTEDEAEVFACEFQEMTRPEGLATLNQKHGQRRGPDGKMHDYMSLATYNRKLKQAQDELAKLYPEYKA